MGYETIFFYLSYHKKPSKIVSVTLHQITKTNTHFETLFFIIIIMHLDHT